MVVLYLCNQTYRELLVSFAIPLFIERITVDPKYVLDKFKVEFESAKKGLIADGETVVRQKGVHIKTLGSLLLRLVISNFISKENGDYFERVGVRDDVKVIYYHFAEEFEDVALEILRVLKTDSIKCTNQKDSQILELLCATYTMYKPAAGTKEGTTDYDQTEEPLWRNRSIIDIARLGMLSSRLVQSIL